MIFTSLFWASEFSRMNFGTCVVLPHPVSPEMIKTRFFSRVDMILSLCLAMGRDLEASIDLATDDYRFALVIGTPAWPSLSRLVYC